MPRVKIRKKRRELRTGFHEKMPELCISRKGLQEKRSGRRVQGSKSVRGVVDQASKHLTREV